MKLKSVTITIAVVFVSLFVAVGLYATSAPDIIPLDNPGYKKHRKGIVQFTHTKHIKDYNIDCGECHHDDAGKPLALKDGDSVQGCGECHSNFGKLSKADKKLSKAEKIKGFHEQALHANCKGCHKKQKKGPSKCNDCHSKKKK